MRRAEAGSLTPPFLHHLNRNRNRGGIKRHPGWGRATNRKLLLRRRVTSEHVVVEDAKLLDYVLNPEHPIGRHHARLFERLLGITRLNYQVLKRATSGGRREH